MSRNEYFTSGGLEITTSSGCSGSSPRSALIKICADKKIGKTVKGAEDHPEVRRPSRRKRKMHWNASEAAPRAHAVRGFLGASSSFHNSVSHCDSVVREGWTLRPCMPLRRSCVPMSRTTQARGCCSSSTRRADNSRILPGHTRTSAHDTRQPGGKRFLSLTRPVLRALTHMLSCCCWIPPARRRAFPRRSCGQHVDATEVEGLHLAMRDAVHGAPVGPGHGAYRDVLIAAC